MRGCWGKVVSVGVVGQVRLCEAVGGRLSVLVWLGRCVYARLLREGCQCGRGWAGVFMRGCWGKVVSVGVGVCY